ncbi:MFS transporter [Arthrobacter sp. KNU40]|uniref:MFS transporter n=1 Tax=Arthrobacter sp. KNU40 TaxID=3447965 RepID=UPI003F5DC980
MRRQVLLTSIASAVFGFAMFAMSLVPPQLLQLPQQNGYGLGQSMLVVGLVMGPSGLVMMAAAPVSGTISRRFGAKWSRVAGVIVAAADYGLSVVAMFALWQLVLVSIIIGVEIRLAYGAMPALVMSAVPATKTSSANSHNARARSIGSSLSSAVAGRRARPAQPQTSWPFRAITGRLAASHEHRCNRNLSALVLASFLPKGVTILTHSTLVPTPCT